MSANRPLYVPVILGTVRKGRMSLHAARLVSEELGNRAGVETELIDIAKVCLPTNDAGEAVKDPNFSAHLKKADALVIVSPEYNHGYSGLLKHAWTVVSKNIFTRPWALSGYQPDHLVEQE